MNSGRRRASRSHSTAGGGAEKGPRGGKTTRTSTGLVKKNFWLPREMTEQLREAAFRMRVSEADLMRRALEQLLAKLVVVVAIIRGVHALLL